VVPSWAVTTVRMIFAPTARAPVKAVFPVDPRYCTKDALLSLLVGVTV
jgi:hypothetical protein